MIDWTILSPTFLSAVIDWAGAVMAVRVVDPCRATTEPQSKDER
jgi:hypothetical protein